MTLHPFLLHIARAEAERRAREVHDAGNGTDAWRMFSPLAQTHWTNAHLTLLCDLSRPESMSYAATTC